LLIGKKAPSSKPDAEELPSPRSDKEELLPKPKEGPADKEAAKPLPEPPSEDKYYARLESENNVVQVPARNIPIILAALANPNALRNKDLAVFDVSKVDAIDIKNPAGTVKLRKLGEPEKWRLIEDNSIREADPSAVLTLLNMLAVRKQVKDFPTD